MAINNIKGIVVGGAAVGRGFGGGDNAPIVGIGFGVGEAYGVQVHFFVSHYCF
ncbi:hypothetical protein PMAL9190_03023 [Photobacterium malacitanum]|uniref:Uncharacterized protein n=1 Tax=Photobacterium malacitanum TaxID=2204294 RepID=A0A1Y6MM22_9GAMM|nr:hypothetical protein PMAL9190_03023 [Photobacterium malacitanum]